MLAKQDFVSARYLGGDTEDEWLSTEEASAEEEVEEELETPAPSQDEEAENLVARYFTDVRQFALLSRNEEKDLWEHIERAHLRVLRSLYTSPVALSTLTRFWHQLDLEEIPLHQVVACDQRAEADEQTERRRRFGETIVHLQDLAGQVKKLQARCRATSRATSRRRTLRQQYRDLWMQWLDLCEGLELRPAVHEAMRVALEAALEANPADIAVRAAHSAWLRAQRYLVQAKTQMIRSNLRLVIHVANRYRNRGVPFLDLIQEGNIGLMRALEKFEYRRGLKFVTYAHWWVRQAISRAITEQYRTVRLPNHIVERKNKLRAAADRLWTVYGRPASASELGEELGWTAQEVEELQSAVKPIVRLQQPVSEDGSMLADMLEDQQTVRPEETLAEEQLQRRLADCLASLSEREAFVLQRRYGLDCEHPHTLQEIADILGLSRERVRQIERQAFEKLRQPHRSAMLMDFTSN
jgi:RNA polymerase sigma factor (sigma-70 family)